MRWSKIPEAVVRRLPIYLRVLDEAVREGDERRSLSSQELGERAGVSPALVRKDLAWFGEFGKQGVGYEIGFLRGELRRILNLDRAVHVALIGIGALGHALARYLRARGVTDDSLTISLVALFDKAPDKIGERVDDLEIWPLEWLPTRVSELGLSMAMIAVPATGAQDVADLVVESGIKAILNFAPAKLVVPEDVRVVHVDFTLELQRLAYYLTQ